MIAISNLKLAPGADEAQLRTLAAGALKVQPQDITGLRIRKKSLDARKKDDIHYVYTVGVTVRGDERKLVRRCRTAAIVQDKTYPIPRIAPPQTRPVIVGFGPAGMFAALLLARAGARPIVLERGPDAQTRSAQIAAFRAGGPFDPECNVQFGEGGAGTFSDGKLNTGTKDPRGEHILRTFVRFGAPHDILIDAKPHIGTDKLCGVVKAMRVRILELGGEVRFGTRLTSVLHSNGHVTAVRYSDAQGEQELPAEFVILAIGHSARDTFESLLAGGITLVQKPFSIGARIEHPQSLINASQYGAAASHPALGAADYKLALHLPGGRSVYTFCMCPGGTVVAAASEPDSVVTNGMSYYARDGVNANSALLVGVGPEDFGSEHPLAGMFLQREIERRAFVLGGRSGKAPCQTVGDLLSGRASGKLGVVEPSYKPGVVPCDLAELLPAPLIGAMREALPLLGRRLRGFDLPDAVLTGPETRSSSPVRISRDETFQSVSTLGLYPCGEGAGYAGGITSAAVDGVRCAEAILKAY